MHGRLWCLDRNSLAERWTLDDPAFSKYCSIIASSDRLLITNLTGELLLVDITGEKPSIVSRVKVLDEEQGLYAHPALVGNTLYVRGSNSLVALDLSADSK